MTRTEIEDRIIEDLNQLTREERIVVMSAMYSLVINGLLERGE